MSIDTLGRRAAADLRSATSGVDVERSLTQARARGRTPRRWMTVVVVATVLLVLVLGWAGSRVMTDEQSAPPLDSAPSEVVGGRLSVPVEVTVPSGWGVLRDAQAVELRPLDGSDRSIILVGQPGMVFEPPAYRLKPLVEDLVVWTTSQPDLKVRDRFGIDGPGFAWAGTEMELALRPGTSEVPLVPLPSGPDPVTITDADRTFLWDVVYLTDSPPLLVASRSSSADDVVLKSARAELLQSLQVNPPPN